MTQITQQPLPYHFGNPPRAVRKARLDNIALVPLSLLPFKAQYQEIANRLPKDGILVCLPHSQGKMKDMLQKVIIHMRSKGQQVTVLPYMQFQ